MERTGSTQHDPPAARMISASAVLEQVGVFAGIAERDLQALVEHGHLERVRVDRDVLVWDAVTDRRPIVFVVEGQLAVGVFSEAELAERRAAQLRRATLTADELKEESLIKPPPLARTVTKNLAMFEAGEIVNLGARTATRAAPVDYYTTAPSVLVCLSAHAITELASRYPMFETALRAGLSVTRERLAWLFGVKQELLDFFVRQGLSVAGPTVRVRQLELCIDCKQCEEACETRYGAKRLTLGGYQLGLVDFVYTCRTCTDQRCIDPCEYDAIKFDAVRREVVINEANCTGCTACAQSCPYQAIDMIPIDDKAEPGFRPGFRARLEQQGSLAFGPGTGRVARPRRIANKCDHCATYGDQACVSACPTGSLIELDVRALFRERKSAAVAAKLEKRIELLPVISFTDGLGVRDAGEARVRRFRVAPLLMWFVGWLALLACVAEIGLRKYAPAFSYRFHQLRELPDFRDVPESMVLEKVFFRAGDTLSVWCGVIGTALMAVAAIYPMFRRVRFFRWLASNTMWFDFHMMAGWIGPLFIIVHSALRLNSWVSVAFWSMVIVLLSGVLGRYLYTHVPALANGVELEELDHGRAFAQARSAHPAAMADVDRELAAAQREASRIANHPSVARALWWLIVEDAQTMWRNLQRGRRLAKLGTPKAVRRNLVLRTAGMIRVGRSKVVAPKAQLLLHSWKKVHVPFTVILTLFSVAHIYLSWARAW